MGLDELQHLRNPQLSASLKKGVREVTVQASPMPAQQRRYRPYSTQQAAIVSMESSIMIDSVQGSNCKNCVHAGIGQLDFDRASNFRRRILTLGTVFMVNGLLQDTKPLKENGPRELSRPSGIS
jgi:hypothetical protein